MEMAGMGFTPEDYAETVEVWPDNWPAWRLFRDCSTQWRTAGMTGVHVGLVYVPLFNLLDIQGLSSDDWRQTFDDIRALESEALKQMHAPT